MGPAPDRSLGSGSVSGKCLVNEDKGNVAVRIIRCIFSAEDTNRFVSGDNH